MTITTIGIDLAKNVFAVHGVDQNGKTVLVKSRVTRAALPGLIASLPPCVIGMEACSGAYYWARLFLQYGHEPRLMAAKFVSPYRMAGKSGKNDAADAQAICEAVRRPHMRFVPVKDESQQAMQCLHRNRQGFIEEKTATYNRLRGLISEFGVIAPQSTDALRHMVSAQKSSLPLQVQQCVDDLLEHVVSGSRVIICAAVADVRESSFSIKRRRSPSVIMPASPPSASSTITIPWHPLVIR